MVVCPFTLHPRVLLSNIHKGDDAHLSVWKIATGEQMQTVASIFFGPVTTIAWVEYGNIGANRAFVFGCEDGSLHMYRKVEGKVRI